MGVLSVQHIPLLPQHSFISEVVEAMTSSQSFSQKWKINFFVLLVIMISQLLAMILLNELLNEFCEQAYVVFTKRVIFTFAMLICVSVDLFFFYNKISLLKSLSGKKPIRCIIDDILFVKYKDDGRTRYTPYLLVRSIETNKLYFTYGKYSLLGLTASISYGGHQMINCTIYKKDMVQVAIGDCVDAYVYKILDFPILVDEGKNVIKLKNKKLMFHHANDKIHISVFNNIVLFKGAIDVDCVK